MAVIIECEMMLLFIAVMLLSTRAQFYNIESDSLYDTGNMATDIPFEKIHPYHTTTTVSRDSQHEALVSMLSDGTKIKCRHYKDFYYLLYSICERSILCAEAYFIDQTNTASTVPKMNFKKFVHQLSLSQLFLVEGATRSDELFLLEDNVPMEWIPRYLIQLNDASDQPLCSESIDLMSTSNTAFVHSTLYLLHLYKTYVVNEYRCTHYNEWLELDANNHGVCLCKHGKSCDIESNYRHIIVALTIILIGVVCIWIVSFYINTHMLMQKMDSVNRAHH